MDEATKSKEKQPFSAKRKIHIYVVSSVANDLDSTNTMRMSLYGLNEKRIFSRKNLFKATFVLPDPEVHKTLPRVATYVITN